MLLLLVFILSSVRGEELIDLSYPIDENTPYWHTQIPFRYIKKVADSNRGFWYAANQFEISEHSGTHIDAPYHFYELGRKVSEIPLDRLITTGVFLNVSSVTNGNCTYELPVNQLEEWERQNGPFPKNSVLLISFGWASRYDNKSDYLGPPEKMCFPGLSKEASKWITESKKIVGVGLDTPSIDQAKNVYAHIELNLNDIYVLENVAIIQPLPNIFKIIVLPMKIRTGSGAPCRIVAVI